MSLEDTRTALEKRLGDTWTLTYIKWQNVRLIVPKDSNNNYLPYITFTLQNGGGEDITCGSDNRWYRWSGVVIIQIFVPENIGMRLATEYANQIKNIFLTLPRDFTYQNSGVIRLLVPSIAEIGEVNGWCQVNVTIPFKRDSQT